MNRALCSILVTAALAADPVLAQNQSPAISVEAGAGYRASLSLSGLFADPELKEVVESGLPLRVRIRVELWRDRWFDESKGSETWTALLTYDRLSRDFRLITRGSPSFDRRLGAYENARTALEAARTFSLRPSAPGRYYFTANIEIETLSLSDLEELERWLQGGLSGDRSVPGVIGEAAKRLLIKTLSLPTRTLDLKTPLFRVTG